MCVQDWSKQLYWRLNISMYVVHVPIYTHRTWLAREVAAEQRSSLTMTQMAMGVSKRRRMKVTSRVSMCIHEITVGDSTRRWVRHCMNCLQFCTHMSCTQLYIVIIVPGTGSISRWAHELPTVLYSATNKHSADVLHHCEYRPSDHYMLLKQSLVQAKAHCQKNSLDGSRSQTQPMHSRPTHQCIYSQSVCDVIETASWLDNTQESRGYRTS